MAQTFCAGCGTEASSRPDEVVPLCAECRHTHGAGGERSQWMIRKQGERSQGPYEQQVVEEWILKDLVSPDDEISRPGGPWEPLLFHRAFRGWFTPGDPHLRQRLERRARRDRRHRRERSAGLLRTVVALAGLALAVVVPLVALQTGITVLPEPWVASLVERFGMAGDELVTQVRHATDPSAAMQSVYEGRALPGEGVVAALTEPLDTEPRPAWADQPAILHHLRGTAAHFEDDPEARDRAVASLEHAVALSPRDPRMVAALAESRAWRALETGGLSNDALSLVSRAEALAPGAAAVLRARAVVSLANGSHDSARKLAAECLELIPDDLACGEYRGLALLEMGRAADALQVFRDLAERAPHLPRFKARMAEASLARGDYYTAHRAIEAFLEERSENALGHRLACRLAWLTGDYARALTQGTEALRLDPACAETRMVVARLLSAKGRSQQVLAVIRPFLDSPAAEGHALAPEARVVASHALRRLGRVDEAIAYAEQSLEARPRWAPACLARGLGLRDAGQVVEAEKAMKEASFDDIHPVDAGRFLLAHARLYEDQGRDKAALASFERTLEKDPHSAAARFGMAGVFLRLSNLSKAVDTVRAIAPTDFEQRTFHPPYHLCPAPSPDLAALTASFREAVANDLRFMDALPGIEGIIAYHQGNLKLSESRLRRALATDEADDAARAHLARIVIERGTATRAVGILERLVSTQGNRGLYSAMLGLAFARSGNHQAATAAFERALHSVSDLPGAHRRHAEALYLAERDTEAFRAAETAWAYDPLDRRSRRLVMEHGGVPAPSTGEHPPRSSSPSNEQAPAGSAASAGVEPAEQ